MAMKKSAKQKVRRVGLSDRAKRNLLAGTGSVLVILASWWAYYTFTTIAPPKLDKATPQEVTNYLGNDRGFARLNYDNREKFLGQMWEQFAQGDKRAQLAKAFDDMSDADRQVFVGATFEVAKDRFLKQAVKYSSLPAYQQTEFVDGLINQMEAQRRAVAGAGGHSGNLTKSFARSVPSTTDGFTKLLVDSTTPSQRAKAEPLFDAVVSRTKERQGH